MNGYAKIDAYNGFINALNNFSNEINESCQIMAAAAQTCVDGTDGRDVSSLKAQKKVLMCIKDYQELINRAARLAQMISQERDELIDIIREAQKLDE